MGNVRNKAPEQRHTYGDTVGSFLRLLPSIRISYVVKAKGKRETFTVCTM